MVVLKSDILGSTSVLEYQLTNVENISYTASTEPTIINIPEMDKPIVLNFGGERQRVRVDWYIIDSDVDLSNGTYSSYVSSGGVVESIEEQIKYLEQYFLTADVGTTITIEVDEISVSYAGVGAGFNWTWAGGNKKVRASLSIVPSSV